MTAAAESFHQHLDNCDQCRRQPFDLCPDGDRLLMASLARTDLIERIHQAFTAGAADMFAPTNSQVDLHLPNRSLPPLSLDALKEAASLMHQAKPWGRLIGKCQLRPTSYLADKAQALLLDLSTVEYWSHGAGEPRYIVLVDRKSVV